MMSCARAVKTAAGRNGRSARRIKQPLTVLFAFSRPKTAGLAVRLESVGCIMRLVVAATALVLGMAAAAEASEWRMFIVANDPDGYGIDRCLVSGEKCGTIAANAYCKAQDYAQADSFRKVDRNDITGTIPAAASGACRGSKCSVVAIICTR